jgi:hypothetical protein
MSITALDIVAFIATSTNVSHLTAIANAIKARCVEIEDGALWRDLVRDQRVNPQHAIPPAATEWNAHRHATFDDDVRQRADARANGGAAVSHGRWG